MSAYRDHLEPLAEGNDGVRRTLERMRDMIRVGAAVRAPGGISDAMIEDTFYWVRGHLHYQEHPPGEQTLITPHALMDMINAAPDRRAVGDCVSYTVLLGFLLYTMGTPVALVVRSKRDDGIYDHVYLRVQTSEGWMAADASGDAAFGWEDADVIAREDMSV